MSAPIQLLERGQAAIHFDATELNQALAKLAVVSEKLPSELVNQKGQFIFGRAAKKMKVVERMTIQEELGASAAQVLVKTKSGRFSRAQKHVHMFFGTGNILEDKGEFSLLSAIVQSRATKDGKPSPWAGVPKEEGARLFQAAAQKIYNARQKSRGYFRRCFQIAANIYRSRPKEIKFSLSKIIGQEVTEVFEEGDLMERRGKMADVKLAEKNKPAALSTFWVKSTERDQKDALDKYAAPVLQESVDAEAESTFEHEAELEYKAAIRALGIKVS